MQSRMDRYRDNNVDMELEDSSLYSSRIKKNQDLYKEVGNLELHEFDLNSNASVIGDSNENIYIDEIQDILSEKYREDTRRKSFGDTEEISLPKINLDETREYDLNSVLEKVKETKETSYEDNRLRKIRSTQYDILKDLDNLTNDEDIEDEDLDLYDNKNVDVPEEKSQDDEYTKIKQSSEEELLGLINTIVSKEKKYDSESFGDLDPLDILSDLRGDEDTKVMGAIQMDEEDENTLGLSTSELDLDNEQKLDYIKEDEKEIELSETSEKLKVNGVDENTFSDSFMTASVKITEDDFDDFDDLKEKGGFGKFLIKFIIFLIIIAFIAGVIVLANKFLNLGLF